MLVLLALQFVRQRTEARLGAERRTGEAARLIAARLDEFTLRVELLLQAAALQVRVNPPNLRHNDSVLTLLSARTLGILGTLNVRDTADRLIGTSCEGIRSIPRLATRGRRYFTEAVRTRRFAVGAPVRAQTDSTLWVVSFGLPIPDARGEPIAVAFSTSRVDSLRPLIDPGTLSPTSLIMVLDVDGRVLFRNIESRKFEGRDVGALPTFRHVFSAATGTVTARSDLDSVERILTWQRTRRAPWSVIVGVPLAEVLASEAGDARRDLLFASLSVVLALVVATVLARRISQPIVALTSEAQGIARGDFSRQPVREGSSEIGILARQFRAMSTTLEHQTSTLRESEERYRALFELSPLPMLLCEEEDHRFLMVNAAALRLYGRSSDEMLALSAADIQPPESLVAFQAVMKSEGSITGRRSVHHNKAGGRLDVEVNVARTSAFGQRAWLAVVTDLTERSRTELALRESQEQLRQMQKIEAVGSLAAGIAHDFNNLLTGILGSCDLALAALPRSHEASEEIQHARDAAVRATELTKRLLTFSRQKSSAATHVDLREVVRGMQSMLARTLGEQVRLDLQLDDAPCTVFADRSQLEQVVLNLLVNSRDAMPDGGHATIAVRALGGPETASTAARPDGGPWVMLEVSDTGSGMDPETAARAFEPFFTTKERGKGTGLGLAVVYSIVENAGGQLRVQTAAGAGTTMRIYLPLLSESPTPAMSPDTAKPVTGGGETILVVEDEDAVRRVTVRLLESLGYAVLNAPGPRQALQVARDHIGEIHLVLTDVIMPGMNGREVAEAMRKLRPRVKIVYVSGYTDDIAIAQQLRTSALFFLQKPFSTQALSRTIRAALDAPPDVT